MQILGPETIEKKPSDKENLTIECQFKSSATSKIQWAWNGNAIENETSSWSINENFEENNGTSQLTKRGILESGNISCTALAADGNFSATVALVVTGPGSPPRSIKATPILNQIELEWSEPAITNGEIQVDLSDFLSKDIF